MQHLVSLYLSETDNVSLSSLQLLLPDILACIDASRPDLITRAQIEALVKAIKETGVDANKRVSVMGCPPRLSVVSPTNLYSLDSIMSNGIVASILLVITPLSHGIENLGGVYSS
jgi:hypothetical protein